MTKNDHHFCSMRKVRNYLKKHKFLSNINRHTIYKIFYENTQYYLEGKITRKFYFSLIAELYYYGCEHLIWRGKNDSLSVILTTLTEFKDANSDEQIKHINTLLVNYYSKQPLVIFR